MEMLKAKKLQGILASDPDLFDKLENKITGQGAIYQDPECRQKFCNYCITKETETVFNYSGKTKFQLP